MWIISSLIYALTNALYINYNDHRHYNGYILGIWRGFGVSLLTAPLLLTVPINLSVDYIAILIFQGILIGIYDSRIFFASAKFGGHTGSGFISTAVLITTFLWWAIEFNDLKKLLLKPQLFITIILILSAYSISYWQMMRTKVNKRAEQYLYPAVFALSLMSIATRYIALRGGTLYAGIIYYLTIACFVSGIYNTIMYFKNKKTTEYAATYPTIRDSIWLISFSTILIAAKTAAMRLCDNPGYVVAVLLLSPLIAEIIETHRLKMNYVKLSNLLFLIILLLIIN